MCNCIIITVGTDIPFDDLKSCRENHCSIEELNGEFFKKHLPTEERESFFLKNMPNAVSFGNLVEWRCSCGIYGYTDYEKENTEKEKNLVKKYSKKGYSSNRIEKIISERREVMKKKNEPYEVNWDRSPNNVLKSIFEKGSFIYLYCHKYWGGHKYRVIDKVEMSTDVLSEPIGKWLPEDVIVTIHK